MKNHTMWKSTVVTKYAKGWGSTWCKSIYQDRG